MRQTITSIEEAEAALRPFVPLVAQLTGADTTLRRIRALMELLDHPEKKLRAVHIAGTSGKTSTAYYVANLLGAAGKKVGLTVSPHIDSVAERVQINGLPLPDKQFCNDLAEFLAAIEAAPERPSYFELLYAFAVWEFARYEVDYAVLETGMGGLHDATNITAQPDKFCIITDIGFDHTRLLGSTLPEITLQKIGIVHQGNTVLIYQQAPEVMSVVEAWTRQHQARLIVATEETEAQSYPTFADAMPLYQQRNWLLAYRAYRELATRDALPLLSVEQLARSQALQVPGRMDRQFVEGKQIVMDGAHNVQKMATFIASFQSAYPGVKPVVLLALKQDKDSAGLGPLLATFTDELIITKFTVSQDLRATPADPEELATIFRRAGVPKVSVINDNQVAYQALLAATRTVGVVTGSFYLLSQLRSSRL